MQNLTDIEILEWNAGGQFIKDMTALSFIGWVAGKLNGQTINPIIQELRMVVSAPPMTGRLSAESKIATVRKMIEAGIVL